MVYLSHVPRAPLSEFVERMWLVEGGESPRQDRILPSGTVELVVNLRDDWIRIDRTVRSASEKTVFGATVSGTYSEAFIVDAKQHAAMIGVHFRPAGARAVLGVPPPEFTNAHVELAALWGDGAARDLRDRLGTAATHRERFQFLERVLSRRLPMNRRPPPAVLFALERFGPGRLWRVSARRRATKRIELSTVPDTLPVRGGTATETVLPYLAVPAGPCGGAASRANQLDRTRTRVRLVRSGASHQ